MNKVKGDYWKTEQNVIKIQIKTDEEQEKLEQILSGWTCVSFGYAPKTSEDIYVFEKRFESDIDWTSFLNSDRINKLIEMREITND